MSTLRRILSSPIAAAAVALGLRLAAMNVLHTYRFPPDHEYYAFGTEMGRIARSIVWGRGFSSPLHGPTGPTAMVGPVYPYLIAGVFRLFGVYSTAAAWILLALNSVFSALTCLTVAAIGRTAFGRGVGTWAAWIWAIFPFAIYWPVKWVWDTSLSTLLFSAAFLATIRIDATSGIAKWVGFGLLWGIVVLTNTTFLALFPLAVLWLSVRRQRCGNPWIAFAGIATLVCLLPLAPWIVRNHLVFGRWLLRSNLGLELAAGNLGGTIETKAWLLHPAFNEAEMENFRRQGELAYMAQKQREALHYIATNPQTFLRLSLRRAAYFWTGATESQRVLRFPELLYTLSSVLALIGLVCAAASRNATSPMFAFTVVVYPLVYYITLGAPRYRHLIEPEIVILGTYAVARILSRAPRGAPANLGHAVGPP